MSPDEKKQFAILMTGLSEAYSREVSKALMLLYWNALAEYPIDAVDASVQAHIRNPEAGRFFPRVADLIAGIDGSSTDKASAAWAKVLRAIEVGGVYETFVFDDPLIHAVVANMGGISVIALAENDAVGYRSAEFHKAYASLSARGAQPAYPPKLVGLNEAGNRSRGLAQFVVEPTFIGDAAVCERVLTCGAATAIPASVRAVMALPASAP